jgi:HAD superfamily hydrolase (TIGR01509 family)
MIRAVVFDFDGVLANSEPLHFQAFRDVLAEEAIPLSESAYYAKYLGFDDAGAFEAIASDVGRAWQPGDVARLIARKAVLMEELERHASVLFPGAREAILRMVDLGPIAIASGALRMEIERVLVREELRARFPVLVSAEDTPMSKPDPAPYRLAVEQLSAGAGGPLRPQECVAVEDSRWGLVSAREAGLHTIAITHSYGAEHLTEADRIITHLDMLTVDLLRTL